MKGSLKYPGSILRSCLIVCSLFLVGTGCERQPPLPGSEAALEESPHVGFTAPGFSVTALEGAARDLADSRGKILLINFWATWCMPCLIEMPSMETLYARHGREDFEILAISGGERGNVVQTFVDDLKLSFPVALDPEFEVHEKYQVMTIPSTYLVDREGMITHRFFGSVDWDEEVSRELVAQLIRSR